MNTKFEKDVSSYANAPNVIEAVLKGEGDCTLIYNEHSTSLYEIRENNPESLVSRCDFMWHRLSGYLPFSTKVIATNGIYLRVTPAELGIRAICAECDGMFLKYFQPYGAFRRICFASSKEDADMLISLLTMVL